MIKFLTNSTLNEPAYQSLTNEDQVKDVRAVLSCSGEHFCWKVWEDQEYVVWSEALYQNSMR